ncbi:hypothetical protein CGRA01v4_13494 [Colletotrichum graminicola]|nr:hypothetical protein CGRA01v4_13494 [Colletotrichum graminicola]
MEILHRFLLSIGGLLRCYVVFVSRDEGAQFGGNRRDL